MSKNMQQNYSNRSSRQTSSQSINSRPPSRVTRVPSELLCDLHVYKVPPDLWREAFNNILNNAVTETVSVGIIRVPIEIRLLDIREEIVQQLGLTTEDLIPKDYVFLRSVGRSLTTLRLKQEYQLKAKHFIPPVAYAPELFILEATPEVREALAGSNVSSQSPPMSRQMSPRGYSNNYRGPVDAERRSKPNHGTSPPAHKNKPLPHIVPDPYNHTQSSPSPHSRNYPCNDPYHMNHHNNKNSPKRSKQPHEVHSDQPGSEWEENPENKQSTKVQSPPLKRGSLQSVEKGRIRRHDDDSDVADLSPEDDYENIFRKAKDLQKHLDSDRFSFDETEEENRRRLEDLESRSLIDRERWDADQDERRRRAKEDRLKANEKKREKEDEEKRHKEDQERKKRLEEEQRKKEEEEKIEKEERIKRQEEENRRKEENRREEEQNRREEDKNRREEEQKRKQDEEKKKQEEDKKRELEKKDKEESERKKREELEKHRKDEQEKRRNEEEKERRQREERERQKEEENRRKLKELISPPEEVIRDTESARQRRRDDKNQLLKDIEEAKQARHDQEKIREDLVRKAKQMQHKTTNRRNEARDMWKKKYFEEKKKTAPLEENSNRLRNELETLHKRLVNSLEGPDPKERHLRISDSRPVEKNNFVIQSTKLQHEIEDLQRRVENARMKLTAEMKLRNQAQGELRALRAELTQRTQSIELNRQHHLASLNSPRRNDKENSSPVENINTNYENSKSFLGRL